MVYDLPSSLCKRIEGSAKELGSKYQCKVKEEMEEEFEDGYYFYTLSKEQDGSINLIMDRNINSDGTPATKAIIESEKSSNEGIYNLVAYNLDGDVTNVGPVTAMNFLNNATSLWSNIENLNITYNDEGNNFFDFKIIGKARLPYNSEIENYKSDNSNSYLGGYIDTRGGISSDNTIIPDIYGYWTLSSQLDICDFAYFVDYDGYLDSDFANIAYQYGVRPVINIKL